MLSEPNLFDDAPAVNPKFVLVPIPTYPRIANLTGNKYGRLTVVGYAGRKGKRHVWLCRCECGGQTVSESSSLKGGNTKSCGCFGRENSARRLLKHGGARIGRTTSEYKCWTKMIERCVRPSATHYDRYGGRGIEVCDRWRHSFANFISDMGPKPPGLNESGKRTKYEIERNDSNGHYCPENCRWATRKEQARNKCNNRIVTAFGRSQCIAAWAEETGSCQKRIRDRLERGWEPERAVWAKPVRSQT